MARVFSLKSTSQHIWVYIVWAEIRCIKYDKIAKQNVLQVSCRTCFVGILQEGLTCKTLTKSSYQHSVMTLHIPIMCQAHASLCGKATCELPMKISLVFNCLESSHSLSHTTLTIKSHIKYMVQKIKHNYNQI